MGECRFLSLLCYGEESGILIYRNAIVVLYAYGHLVSPFVLIFLVYAGQSYFQWLIVQEILLWWFESSTDYYISFDR